MNAGAAGVAAAVVLLLVAAFQVAAAAGAPVGRSTQGGRHEGGLPRANRVVAAVSVVLLAAMAAVVAGEGGRGPLASIICWRPRPEAGR